MLNLNSLWHAPWESDLVQHVAFVLRNIMNCHPNLLATLFATEEVQPAQETEEPSICYKHFAHLPFWQLQWEAALLTPVQVQNYSLHFSGWLKTGTRHFEHSTSLNIDSYSAVLQLAGLTAQVELTIGSILFFLQQNNSFCNLQITFLFTVYTRYCILPALQKSVIFFSEDVTKNSSRENTAVYEINYFCLLFVS